ncbi:MAG TPA: hypothetical protein VHK25_03840, partial [Acidimicrobiales bacterium]|nr:hypothetical protein [Acidimicrobiales bacterium]
MPWRSRVVATALASALLVAVLDGDRHEPETASSAARTPATTPTTNPAATTTASPPTTAPPPRSFTLVATGDVLLHGTLWAQAEADAAATGKPGFDFRPLLAHVAPVVNAA